MGDHALTSRGWKPALAADAAVVPPGYPPRPAGLRTFFTPDLRPARAVNDWVVATEAALSDGTANSYAYLIARFANYLDREFNTGLLGPEVLADGDVMLRGFGAMLTSGAASEGPIKVGVTRGTVSSHRSALMSFYNYCVSTGWLSEFPFTLRTARTRSGDVETLAFLNGGRIADPDREGIPASQLERYLSVGLLGLRPEGDPDPSFRGIEAAQRNAAGFGLGVAMGLRHSEALHTTIFEIPDLNWDGLTPGRVAASIAKGRRARKVVALSKWLEPVHAYIDGDRMDLARRATWVPKDPLFVDVDGTNRERLTVANRDGVVGTYTWGEVSKEDRRRLVVPNFGSPLVLLDHHYGAAGAPLTNTDSLNNALRAAGERCRYYWPSLPWSFTTHYLRHTYADEISMYLADSDRFAAAFREEFGRDPSWLSLLRNQDQTRIVQESMGHRSPATTNGYRAGAFHRLLLSMNADPTLNPAAREATS